MILSGMDILFPLSPPKSAMKCPQPSGVEEGQVHCEQKYVPLADKTELGVNICFCKCQALLEHLHPICLGLERNVYHCIKFKPPEGAITLCVFQKCLYLGLPCTRNFPDIFGIPHSSAVSGRKSTKCWGKSRRMVACVGCADFAETNKDFSDSITDSIPAPFIFSAILPKKAQQLLCPDLHCLKYGNPTQQPPSSPRKNNK